MLFNSLKYAIFLPVVLLLFWLCPQRLRLPILLIASYVFYMSWRPVYIVLILALTVANYIAGLLIHKAAGPTKKAWLIAGVSFNLIMLAFFKYAYFFNDAAAAALRPAGVNVPPIGIEIVLPLGISFFVFEFIHYIADVYKGGAPVTSFGGFALFASFFPTQIAGPIKRYQDFVPQFLTPSKFKMEYFEQGLPLILVGLFKKVLLADNLSLFVMGGFAHPELFSGLDLWIFAYAFAFQIYFDFSGYTDVARGSAILFGYKVPINFNLPYLASNISDFWHRWHISLSTWLRDYLFIPLGGSRGPKWLNLRNLVITMTLGGLWHGAAMHFLLWGFFHGVMLVLHKLWQQLTNALPMVRRAVQTPIGHWLSVALTFHVVCVGWVLFRAENMSLAMMALKKMFFVDVLQHSVVPTAMALSGINYPLIYPAVFVLLPVFAVAHILMGYLNKRNAVASMPVGVKAAWCFALMLMILVLSPDKSPRFIYFQF